MTLLALRPILALSVLSSALGAQTPSYQEIRGDGYIAHVHRPPAAAHGPTLPPAPAVVLIGGSGGGIGWQDYVAERLAQRGFVAMAVAYFGMDGLPPALERIPLEAFDRAVEWLAAQPDVDSTCIGIGGVSKGAEAALLLAARRTDLRAVAVFAPSAVVFQSIAPGFPLTSSWTEGGTEVPFVPFGQTADGGNLADYYRAGIEQVDSLALERATIKVERIAGPVLLLSGRDDTLWPSTLLGEMVVSRLRSHRFPHPLEHVAYEHAGHLISSIRSDDVTYRGGTIEGNAAAQRDGQRRFFEFFERALRTRVR
jgi:dienelactone hydrolase